MKTNHSKLSSLLFNINDKKSVSDTSTPHPSFMRGKSTVLIKVFNNIKYI